MRLPIELVEQFRVPHGKKIRLKDFDPGWIGERRRTKEEVKRYAQKLLAEDVTALAEVQERLYASDSWSILLIFQAMDAAGKDGTIKHVMSGVNPQGVQVTSFKHPSAKELEHNFLWRCSLALPERGRIGIFNRSYYEEVLVVKVHPELVVSQRIPDAKPSKAFWEDRYEDINNFERHLARNGTVIRKFFLHVSKNEQRKRLLERINDPRKNWKFSAGDLAERDFWDDYMEAYEDALNETSTRWAPWYVIPADHKWVSRAMVANIVVSTIESLHLKYPEVTDEQRREIGEAKKKLSRERN